jgi:hypothetical protein
LSIDRGSLTRGKRPDFSARGSRQRDHFPLCLVSLEQPGERALRAIRADVAAWRPSSNMCA